MATTKGEPRMTARKAYEPEEGYVAGKMAENYPGIQTYKKYAGSESKSAHKRHVKLHAKKAEHPKEGVEYSGREEHRKNQALKLNVDPVITAVGGGSAMMVMNPTTAGRENHFISKKEVMNSTYIFPRLKTAMMELVDPSPQ